MSAQGGGRVPFFGQSTHRSRVQRRVRNYGRRACAVYTVTVTVSVLLFQQKQYYVQRKVVSYFLRGAGRSVWGKNQAPKPSRCHASRSRAMAEPHALSPVDAVVHNIPEVVELLPGAPGFVGSDSMPSASSFCGVHKGDAHTGGWTDPREAVL